MTTTSIRAEKRVFSLQEAKALLPFVRKVTLNVVGQVNDCVARLEVLADGEPEYDETRSRVDGLVREWAEQVQKLGCLVKGLWLVDFDNGHGYYCWNFPEEDVDHFHGYDEAFANRTRIC